MWTIRGHPYAKYTRADLPKGAVWPFDDGRYFILLNLAMGGQWPGPPNAEMTSVEEMLVDCASISGYGAVMEVRISSILPQWLKPQSGELCMARLKPCPFKKWSL